MDQQESSGRPLSEAYPPCWLPLQLAMGKMMEQGPVLIVTFQAQLVMVIKNPKGEVVEGDPVSEEGGRMGQVASPGPAKWWHSALMSTESQEVL